MTNDHCLYIPPLPLVPKFTLPSVYLIMALRSRYSRRTRRYGRRNLRTRPYRSRVSRRRLPPRRRMTRRSVLNLTSQKKADAMAPANAVTAAGVITTGGQNILSGASPTYILFSPTARIQSSPGLVNNQSMNPSALRTSERTYAKGISETVRLTWDNGTSWVWRRIVFSCKTDPSLVNVGGFFNGSSSVASISNSAVPQTARIVIPQNSTDVSTTIGLVYQGRAQEDTYDAATAPIDRERVRVHYDRTRVLNCPSGTATSRIIKMYLPLNKGLYYNDDERGVGEGTTSWTASGSSPLGDVYIWDMFESATAPGTAATLTFNPECRYYWHER